jgi:hypothetical protein
MMLTSSPFSSLQWTCGVGLVAAVAAVTSYHWYHGSRVPIKDEDQED